MNISKGYDISDKQGESKGVDYIDKVLNFQHPHGRSPLHFAWNRGQRHVVKYLLQEGANPEIITGQDLEDYQEKWSSFVENDAEITIFARIARGILALGADIVTNSLNQRTVTMPLHTAVAGSKVNVVKFLRILGADPKVYDLHGKSAFNYMSSLTIGKDKIKKALNGCSDKFMEEDWYLQLFPNSKEQQAAYESLTDAEKADFKHPWRRSFLGDHAIAGQKIISESLAKDALVQNGIDSPSPSSPSKQAKSSKKKRVKKNKKRKAKAQVTDTQQGSSSVVAEPDNEQQENVQDDLKNEIENENGIDGIDNSTNVDAAEEDGLFLDVYGDADQGFEEPFQQDDVSLQQEKIKDQCEAEDSNKKENTNGVHHNDEAQKGKFRFQIPFQLEIENGVDDDTQAEQEIVEKLNLLDQQVQQYQGMSRNNIAKKAGLLHQSTGQEKLQLTQKWARAEIEFWRKLAFQGLKPEDQMGLRLQWLEVEQNLISNDKNGAPS